MSAHRAQTSSGMTPARMRRAKALHPRQYANTDSSVAATMIDPMRTSAPVQKPRPVRIDAVPVKDAPISWANRFGGPGTSLGAT